MKSLIFALAFVSISGQASTLKGLPFGKSARLISAPNMKCPNDLNITFSDGNNGRWITLSSEEQSVFTFHEGVHYESEHDVLDLGRPWGNRTDTRVSVGKNSLSINEKITVGDYSAAGGNTPNYHLVKTRHPGQLIEFTQIYITERKKGLFEYRISGRTKPQIGGTTVCLYKYSE